MNKTAIKNFAVWARNKLIADITYKAGLLGITVKEIKTTLPQSTKDVQFFDIGTKEPYSISGIEMKQREKLTEVITKKAKQSDYKTAYKAVVEEVAYTWFNRMIAVRFMEVNDYLPSRIRVLSSVSTAKIEPDLVTMPFDTDLEFTPYEKDRIVQLKNDNKLDELFQMLFIKQCNALNAILPNLFEKTSDYTELLLNVSFTDKEGVIYRLVHDIPEDDFNVSKEGQVEIIGWLYQYYNTEPKDEAFELLKKNVKITKERIPAATQLFTPDWIVRYMVENSLGRLWLEGHPNDALKSEWKYYLDEAEQESDVQKQLEAIREEYKTIKPEDIKVIDPCMGSGHILVYAYDVLMQIYESFGYSQREAAKSILVYNIYGLDIDNRAYQLANFALMMKARQYNRRILDGQTDCHVYSIQESNGINRDHLKYFGAGMSEIEQNTAILQVQGLLDTFVDAKEYGSILNVGNYNWELLYRFLGNVNMSGQLSLDAMGFEVTKEQLHVLVEIGATMAQKYDVVVTNPPYMGISNGNGKLNDFVKKYYPDSKSDLFAVFIEKCSQMIKTNCYQAMITQHAWMYLSSYEKLRENIQMIDTINMVHLGARAFEEINGEVVQTASFVLRKSHTSSYKSTYVRLVGYNSQQEKEKAYIDKRDLYTAQKEHFSKIPGMPVAYWLSAATLKAFRAKCISEYGKTRRGLQTGNANRFIRYWFEVSKVGLRLPDEPLFEYKWAIMNNGGTSRKWYGEIINAVLWENNGATIKGTGKAIIPSEELYFRECITWNRISVGALSVKLQPSNIIQGDMSPFYICDDLTQLFYILGFMNSRISRELIHIINPTITMPVGDIAKLPIIFEHNKVEIIDNIVKENIAVSKEDWDSFEISWDFTRHPLRLLRSSSARQEMNSIDSNTSHLFFLETYFKKWETHCNQRFVKLKQNEEEINTIFIDIYGMQNELTPEVEDKDVAIRKADLGRDIRSFVSYAVGCMFGRYSLDKDGLVYAGGQWEKSKYSTFIPDKDNILPITDEEYFEDDIVGLFVAFVKKVYGAEKLEQNLDFIANALGNKGNTSREIIRNYFVKDFFKDHCKVYQKRPIYWLFDSGKADGFKALIYMHRYDENTIGNMRIDYLHRMQRVYESEIARMQDTIENSANAREIVAAEKRKEKLIKQLKETKEYDEKIAHLALARITIDLDDGVAVNYEKVQTGNDNKKLDILAKI